MILFFLALNFKLHFERVHSNIKKFTLGNRNLIFWARTLNKFIQCIEALNHIIIILLSAVLIIIGLQKISYSNYEIIICSRINLKSKIILKIKIVAFNWILEKFEHLIDKFLIFFTLFFIDIKHIYGPSSRRFLVFGDSFNIFYLFFDDIVDFSKNLFRCRIIDHMFINTFLHLLISSIEKSIYEDQEYLIMME